LDREATAMSLGPVALIMRRPPSRRPPFRSSIPPNWGDVEDFRFFFDFARTGKGDTMSMSLTRRRPRRKTSRVGFYPDSPADRRAQFPKTSGRVPGRIEISG
jgi:hypothetical protein